MAAPRAASRRVAGPAPVEVPTSPLWHLGKVGVSGRKSGSALVDEFLKKESQSSLKVLQDAIDYLTKKAKARLPFTSDEKEFLKEIYEALWWGGHYKGFPEAARLADHYVNGSGEEIEIDAEVYSTSVIVKDAQTVMRSVIAAELPRSKGPFSLKSTDPRLLKRKDWLHMFGQRHRKAGENGYLVKGGILLAEQNNTRLKNADNRFALDSISQGDPKHLITTTWKVRSYYDFEPFSKASHFTNIPLAPGMKLVLPDGLSQHMTVIGVAREFWYHAEWKEDWAAAAPNP